jgi:transcription initiation factor TFIIE subunit alpha
MSPHSAFSMVEKIVGQEAVTIFKILTTKKTITAEQIVQRTGLRMNIIRKTLYMLNESQIVTCRCERDPQTGWFIYYWFICQEGLTSLIQNRQKEVFRVLQQRYDFESQDNFYTCENMCQKLVFSEAFDVGFKCLACNSLLYQIDNKILITILKGKIIQLSKVIKDFESVKLGQ